MHLLSSEFPPRLTIFRDLHSNTGSRYQGTGSNASPSPVLNCGREPRSPEVSAPKPRHALSSEWEHSCRPGDFLFT